MSEMSIDFAIKVLSSAKVARDNSKTRDYTMQYYDKARNLAIKALKEMRERQMKETDSPKL